MLPHRRRPDAELPASLPRTCSQDSKAVAQIARAPQEMNMTIARALHRLPFIGRLFAQRVMDEDIRAAYREAVANVLDEDREALARLFP